MQPTNLYLACLPILYTSSVPTWIRYQRYQRLKARHIVRKSVLILSFNSDCDSHINQWITIAHEIYRGFDNGYDVKEYFLTYLNHLRICGGGGGVLKLRQNGILGTLLNLYIVIERIHEAYSKYLSLYNYTKVEPTNLYLACLPFLYTSSIPI